MEDGLSAECTWPLANDAIGASTIPRLTVFELPVFVRRAETALHLLGGAPTLAAQVYGASAVADLRLRPGDALSHPVRGARAASQGFIVRVRPGAGAVPPSCAFVGTVCAAYRWTSLADFQYLPEGAPLAADSAYAGTFIEELNRLGRGGGGGGG